MRILIIKTSSLGDILQTMPVLDLLHKLVPNAQIDWAVETAFQDALAGDPRVHKIINWRNTKELRQEKYDLLFDLQGNCKSGLATLLARAKVKVGYGFYSVREWPNVLATHLRFHISKQQNIQTFYLSLIARYFGVETPKFLEKAKKPVRFERVMVCFGSRQVNKQLKESELVLFLQKLEAQIFLMWGNEAEQEQALRMQALLPSAEAVGRLSIAAWKEKMREMDLVIAVDSAALHLCAGTQTPIFSIFGPTSPVVFAPPGAMVYQGKCPYGQTFDKLCPRLRNCSTGACMKEIKGNELYQSLKAQVELK
jgi:heptosyltransferase I